MYLNIVEVDTAVINLAAAYPSITQLITLPNTTFEGRTSHAIRLGAGAPGSCDCVMLLGGVHAREWGSCEILIDCAADLLEAYSGGMGLTYGGKSFTASDIQNLMNGLHIIIFPLVNPDGRNYSQTVEPFWRRNRNPANSGGNASCIGVDINRNYDFLFDFQTAFSSASDVSIYTSANPCNQSQVYHGPAPFSEPETRNVKWLMDMNPRTRWFLDVHSYAEDILFNWGDDDNQSTNPAMNFLNTAFNGLRGIAGDTAYKEFIPSEDLATAQGLATRFRDALQAVRGKSYTAKPSFQLYPTAGASDDYAYSRHFVDPGKENIYSYTIEWGTEFQPIWPEMELIIKDVSAGLIDFSLGALASLPVKACAFIIERSTLGQDEIDARRTQPHGQPGGLPVQDAFRVVVDGFSASQLGITGPGSTLSVPSPTGGITINCTGNTSDNGDYGPEAQRFTFFYSIDFDANDTAFNFAGPTEFLTLNAAIAGVFASAQIELIKQPDPFILHGDPAWLSVDLRVFVVKMGETRFGVTMGNDASAAPVFIQKVMAALTAGKGSAGGETFANNLSTSEDASKLFIFPTDKPGGNGQKVFNFALAKVHYIGLIGAQNVRVFFRLFQAQSSSTAFSPLTTYRTAPNNPHGQKIALAGIQGDEYVTIPCFATRRIDSTVVGMDQQTDDPYNVQNFTAIGGPEVDMFYGCWLDINQPQNDVLPIRTQAINVDGPFTDPLNPALPIQQAILRNPHQCLVAEIAFDPVAIPVGKDPGNWDKLAQRNIAWSDIPNPGVDGSRLALDTFEIRPTQIGLPSGDTPDELMIDWGNTPSGSMASIYLPAVNVTDILATAARMYTTHRLARVDDHTMQCKTGGITYIPIPPGLMVNYAGLLSIDLPATVRKGQVFNVVVRQVTNAFGSVPIPIPKITALKSATAEVAPNIEWRRVLGAFQLAIPVSTKEVLLEPEERLLSVLRWIQEAIPAENRWFPVFNRYLDQIAGRVKGLGGDPTVIGPSPSGDWYCEEEEAEEEEECEREYEERIAFTGKVEGLSYDRFGDFEGFLLDTEEGECLFENRERYVEELVHRAWIERIVVTVIVERDEPQCPVSIILRGMPPKHNY